MDIYDAIIGLGVLGFILLIIFLIFLPTICAIIVGMWVAGVLHLTGATWWAFMVLFVVIILGIVATLTKE